MFDLNISIIHLDDDYDNGISYQNQFKDIKTICENTFNEFYREYFYHKNSSEKQRFSLKFIPVSSTKQFREAIFVDNETDKISDGGRSCILFLLDYFIRDEHGNEVELSQATVPGEGNFLAWLSTYFPAVPYLIITSGNRENILIPDDKYIPKEYLNNPAELGQKLFIRFVKLFKPEFWTELYEYSCKSGKTSWHTPGHNRGNAFRNSPYQSDFYYAYQDTVFSTDLSVSVDKLGDLSEPDINLETPLNLSRIKSAEIFGSRDTFYITNGTSTSNKAMLMTLLRPGEVVLLDRNCHKSVHQAIVFSGAIPLYMPPLYNQTLGIWVPIPIDILKKYIKASYPDGLKPRLLILTTTTYEGIMYPIDQIAKLCNESGILFYADEAWAPYLRFHPAYVNKGSEFPSRYNATSGAHFVVQSTHKALAAFSQASMIHVTNAFCDVLHGTDPQWNWLQNRFSYGLKASYERFKHELFETLRYWHSTSPHYPMLASLDKAGIQMRLEGMKLLDERLLWVSEFEEFIKQYANDSIVKFEDIILPKNVKRFSGYKKDPLKLILAIKNSEFKEILDKNSIQFEKSTKRTVEFLVTIGTEINHFKSLKAVIWENKRRELLGKPEVMRIIDNKVSGEVLVLPLDAINVDGEMAEINNCIGRVSSQMLVPYPPGIPVFLPGMEITKKMLGLVKSTIRDEGAHQVHGLLIDPSKKKYYLKVMKKDEEQKAKDNASGKALSDLNKFVRENILNDK